MQPRIVPSCLNLDEYQNHGCKPHRGVPVTVRGLPWVPCLAPVRPVCYTTPLNQNLDPSVEPGSNPDVRPEEEPGSLLVLALLALIAGGAAGLICAGFRLALEEADRLRDRVIALAHD